MINHQPSIKFGLSGDIASFSEEAALMYAEKSHLDAELVYLMDMEGVLAALENKEIALGIFPVMNFTGGLVSMAFEAMGRHLFQPIDELWLDVQQCLMTLPGKQKGDIQTIASHPQGLAQCQRYLQQHFPHATQLEWIDTAKAAKDLSEHKLYPSDLKELGRRQQDESPEHSGLYVRMTNPVENTPRTSKAMGIDAHTAVIAPARAAEYYGLSIFKKAIQDQQPNHTIFVIVRSLVMMQPQQITWRNTI